MKTKHRNRKDRWFQIRYGQAEQNVFIQDKTPCKNVFPSDVERTVGVQIVRVDTVFLKMYLLTLSALQTV